MELSTYLRALGRWWFIAAVLVVVAVAGVFLYHQVTDTEKAESKVAVLLQLYPQPGEYTPPQLGFDAVDESNDLAERVAAKLDDGTTAEEIRGHLKVQLASTMTRSDPTPLYSVGYQDQDKDRAIKIANIATTEAIILFEELNTPNSKDIEAAFQTQLDTANADVEKARQALENFSRDNDAYAVPARLAKQVELVAQLRSVVSGGVASGATDGADSETLTASRNRLSDLLALEPSYNSLVSEVSLAAAAVSRLESQVSDLSLAGAASGDALAEAQAQLDEARVRLANANAALANFKDRHQISDLPSAISSQLSQVDDLVISQTAAQENIEAMQESLATEETELNRLSSLEPRYNQLSIELQAAEGRLNSLEQQVLSTIANRTLPSAPQAEVLNDAEIQSNFLMTAVTYVLGLLLAVFVSLSIIYLLAAFEKTPPTVAEVEHALGASVLLRIPPAS